MAKKLHEKPDILPCILLENSFKSLYWNDEKKSFFYDKNSINAAKPSPVGKQIRIRPDAYSWQECDRIYEKAKKLGATAFCKSESGKYTYYQFYKTSKEMGNV